jgi:hypothetical protein
MEVSYDEGLASHVGFESCGDGREAIVEALTEESAGRVLSLENVILRSADAVVSGGRQQRAIRYWRGSNALRVVRDPAHVLKHLTRKPGDPRFDLHHWRASPPDGVSPCRESERSTTAMHEPGKSDGFVVPAKLPNKAGGAPPGAEGVEGRSPAKGNFVAGRQHRTQCRNALPPTFDEVRQVTGHLRGMTCGKSPVRQFRTPGSVRGAAGNRRPTAPTISRYCFIAPPAFPACSCGGGWVPSPVAW